MNRLKVALIAGKMNTPQRFAQFTSENVETECTIFCFSDSHIPTDQERTKFVIFDELADMPGYMKGLAEHIKGFDLIVIYESFQLSSFQGLKTAESLGVPCVCLVDDYRPARYEGYENIRAIQSEVFLKCTAFLCSSDVAKTTLVVEGVSPEKISIFPFKGEPIPADHTKKLSAKFREYLKVGDAKLISILAKDSSSEELGFILDGLIILLKHGGKAANNIRFLLSINEDQKQEIVYKLVDSKVSARTMILTQDIRPFLADLVSASSLLIASDEIDEDSYFCFSPTLASASLVGTNIILIEDGSINTELTGVVGAATKSPDLFATQALTLLMSEGANLKNQCERLSGEYLQSVESLSDLLVAIKAENSNLSKGTVELDYIAKEASNFSNERLDQVLKPFILGENYEERYRAYEILADYLYKKGMYQESVAPLSEALSLKQNSVKVLKMLAQVSYQAQAYVDAKKFFSKLMGISPDDTEAMLGMGMTLWKQHFEVDALMWLEKAAVQSGATEKELNTLCQIVGQLTERELAIEVMERIIECYPNYAPAELALGQLYLQSGQTEQGILLVTKAL